MGDRTYDLGAARAARAEERGEPPVLTIDGREYPLIAEIPWSAVDAAMEGDASEAKLGARLLREVFGDRWGEFLSVEKPTAKDMEGLSEWLFETYGLKSKNGGADPSSQGSSTASESTTAP